MARLTPKTSVCHLRLTVVVAVAWGTGQFLRARRGRKPQVCCWNFYDARQTFKDTSTSGLDGHITISGCPPVSHLFVDTFFEFSVVEKFAFTLPLELQ